MIGITADRAKSGARLEGGGDMIAMY